MKWKKIIKATTRNLKELYSERETRISEYTARLDRTKDRHQLSPYTSAIHDRNNIRIKQIFL